MAAAFFKRQPPKELPMLERYQVNVVSTIRSYRAHQFAVAALVVTFGLAVCAVARAQTPGGNGTTGFGLNVKNFGALGDCRHDDTEALQSAINQINGRTLFFPAGCYLISQPIRVPFATGFRIIGEGHVGTKIQQQTDNTPIIVFTKELTHSWEISDLEFGWSKNQAKEDTNSVGILFSTDTATAGGLFDFTISHVTFDNGFRGIYLAPANHGAFPVWGFVLEDIIAGKLMSGSTINLAPNPGVGMPRCVLRDIYSTQSISEPQIKLYHCTSGTLDNIEDNNGLDTSIDLQSDDAMSVRSVHIEWHHMTQANHAVITAENSKIDFDGITANLIAEVPGKYYLVSNLAGGGSLSLKNIRLGGASPETSPAGIHNSAGAQTYLLHLNGTMKLFSVQGVDMTHAEINSADDAPTSQKVASLGRPEQ